MKSFKSFVAEVAQPKPEEEKRFKDQHEYEVVNHPVAEPHQHTGEIQKPRKKRSADQEGDANYDKAVKNPEKRMATEDTDLEEKMGEYGNWSVKAAGKQKTFRARHAGEALRKATKSGHFGNIALDANKHLRKEDLDEASCSSKRMKEEELSAKQKKIDHNKNGKIDGHDLAMLRAKKKNEEVEQMDEISKDLAQRYKEKATKDRDFAARNVEIHVDKGRYDKAEPHMAKQKKRVIGIAKANKVLNKEEVEQIEEAVKFKKGPMRLKDGSQVMVSDQDAKLLTQMFKDLTPRNQKEMQKVLTTDKAGFEEIRGFAREAL